jgi:hypothetical protein
MIDWNCEPFSRRATRADVGVELAKNFVQLALISATALPEAGPELDGVAAGVVVAGVVADGEPPPAVLPPLPPQAVANAARAQAPRTAAVCLVIFIQLFSNLL